MESFLEPESQGVDDSKEAEHGGLLEESQECVHFPDRDDNRDFEFAFGSNELEGVPFLWASEGKELLKSLLSDVNGACGPVAIILNEEKVVSEIVFGRGIGIAF
jgi:hypothetical protein